MGAKLYVVGTPIGNLEDFSPRAVRILSEVDFIAAEDTRVTLKLLNHFGIKKPMISYFEHNKTSHGEEILARILSGESCAIVTDAGMPAISDPGEDLVRAAHENGVPIESVPGPCAFITALAVSGMPSKRFCFEGFLPADKKEKKERLAELSAESRTMLFYEAPHRLIKTLSDFATAFGGERECAVCKELTKIHETVYKATLSESLRFYTENQPKGEYVIIVKGAQKQEITYTLTDAVNMARELVNAGNPTSFAAKHAASVTGIKKGDIYKELL